MKTRDVKNEEMPLVVDPQKNRHRAESKSDGSGASCDDGDARSGCRFCRRGKRRKRDPHGRSVLARTGCPLLRRSGRDVRGRSTLQDVDAGAVRARAGGTAMTLSCVAFIRQYSMLAIGWTRPYGRN